MKKKILFVAMQMSIHTARWINQISEKDFEIYLCSVNGVHPHPFFNRDITIYYPYVVLSKALIKDKIKKIFSISSLNFEKIKSMVEIKYINEKFITSVLNRLNESVYHFGNTNASIPLPYGPNFLNKIIKKINPDLIHSLEFQTCGYNVLHAKKIAQEKNEFFPKWLATNWGSDIYYYKNFKEHKEQITNLLSEVDYYSCECHRDVTIAKDLGFKGTVLPVMPNTGGLDLGYIKIRRDKIKPSLRRTIMVKGYQSFAGRALTALDAIEACGAYLKDFRVIVYSAATLDVINRVNAMKATVPIEVFEHTYVHNKMLELFSQARVYLSVSVSDAISTSLLESMAMGAFPIQTNTSCCDEWIKDGESGFSISPDNFENIVDSLKNAITNDELVDNASNLNWAVVQKRLDANLCKQKIADMYKSIFV